MDKKEADAFSLMPIFKARTFAEWLDKDCADGDTLKLIKTQNRSLGFLNNRTNHFYIMPEAFDSSCSHDNCCENNQFGNGTNA